MVRKFKVAAIAPNPPPAIDPSESDSPDSRNGVSMDEAMANVLDVFGGRRHYEEEAGKVAAWWASERALAERHGYKLLNAGRRHLVVYCEACREYGLASKGPRGGKINGWKCPAKHEREEVPE